MAAKRRRQKWVPHVRREGSREHVIWWDTRGPHCKEPNCEMNRPEKVTRA